MAKKSGKDLITKEELAKFVAEFRASKGINTPKKPQGYNPLASSTKSLKGDVQLSVGQGGRERYTMKGKSAGEIQDPETRKYLARTEQADYESKLLGKERKHSPSWFNRVVDVLSRGNYASAEAFRRAGTLEDDQFWDFTSGAKGFWDGLRGKKKTTFSDVLEEHDNLKGWKRGAVGLGLDIFADPLTYTGLGLVGKAGKSKDVVNQLNNLGKIESVTTKAGVPVQTVREATGSALVPVKAVKKKHIAKLSPEGLDVYKYAIDNVDAAPSSIVDTAVSKFKKRIPQYTTVDFSKFGDDGLRRVMEDTIRKELKDYPGLAGTLRYAFGTEQIARPDWLASASRHSKDSRFRSLFGDRAKLKRSFENETPGWSSLYGKKLNEEDYLKHVAIHEVGHHISYNLADDVVFKIMDDMQEQFPNVADELSIYGASNEWEALAEGWAEWRFMGNKARPLAKFIGERMSEAMPKAPTKVETSKILEQLAQDTIKSHVEKMRSDVAVEFRKRGDVIGEAQPKWGSNVDEANENMWNAVNKEADERLKKAGFDTKVEVARLKENLIAATARNLDPKIKKQFQLKIGPAAVGIPKVAETAAASYAKIASLPAIKQSIDKFNDLFRASAHIPKGLDHLRAKTQGNSTFLITQHIKVLQSIFDKVPRKSREAVMKALRDGAEQGNAVRGGLGPDGLPVENLVQYVKDEITALEFSRAHNSLTLDELNAFLGDKFKLYNEKKVKSTRFVDDIDEFGNPTGAPRQITETNYTTLMDAILKNDRIKDPAQALYMYSAAVNQAIAKRQMWETIAQTHGVPKNDLGKQLMDKHGWVPVDINPNTKDMLFPKDVAVGMQRINEVFRDSRSTGQFINQYDRALQTFKSVVTRYNPSFHTRTFMGEMLLGYMGGMKNIPKSYALAGKVIKGRNQQFLGQPEEGLGAYGKINDKRLMQASNAMRGASPSNPIVALQDGSKVVIRHPRFGNLTADKVWHLYLETGLKSGYAATDLVRGTAAPITGKAVKAQNLMQNVTESVEDYGRLAHFLDVLTHTKAKSLTDAVNEAAEITRKFHLDYTNVTSFEKNVMTRAIPFYKWIRLSTPVMAEILLTSPGKALMVPKTMQAISEMAGYDTDQFGAFPGGPDAVVPEWLRDHGAMPWGEIAGNTQYLDPTSIFPLAGSTEVAETGGLQALSPYFKVASDLFHGEDNYGNKLRGEGADDRTKYAAMQTPQTSFAHQMITKRDPGIPRWQSLAQFIANPGNQPNTEKRMRGEAFRQQQEAYKHRKALQEELGLR